MKNLKCRFSLTIKVIGIFMACLLTACATSNSSSSEKQSVEAANPFSIYVKNNTAYISGVLTADLPKQLTDMVKQHPNVTDIVLVDVPGTDDQEATMEGARLIRRLGLNTHIAPTGYVLSGGVDLFLGGVKRTIGAGAGVGVHAWSDEIGTVASKLNRSNPIHATYVNFYLEMGIPERFYWFSIKAAPSNRVYFLSPEEMYDYNLVTE